MRILASASVACAGASRTARGIAGQGGTLSKILRAGAVAIAASPTKYGLKGIAGAAETPARATERARDAHPASSYSPKSISTLPDLPEPARRSYASRACSAG